MGCHSGRKQRTLCCVQQRIDLFG
ncbi:Rev1 [SIV-wrc Pbt-05GM-X02]|uniref:Rev1 n=1 Tax=SIV-wrc Pbt-05GM-X02 TaxID=498715 RepID=B3CKG4_SIV|nr:Rev1 [SIV-wrc Pbt-05GM-X02]